MDSATFKAEIGFYRINVGDIDGNFYRSQVIKVLIKQNDFEALSIYPTIISSSANIVLSSPFDNISLKLINSGGILVSSIIIKYQKV